MDAAKLSALADRGDLAFCDPIVITHDRIVIDGYARWELAQRIGRKKLDCIEYEFSSEEALGELIRTHCPSRGLTDFVRVELALDMEPSFQQKGLLNQQAGGLGKGSSRLTIAQRVDSRREVARLASVSSGNVRKVKNILAHGCSSMLEAARTEEVSINLADKWSHEPARIGIDRVEYLAKDTRNKRCVLKQYKNEEFIDTLIQHVPDPGLHAMRYFGLLSPRCKARVWAAVFVLLNQQRRPHPPRLPWRWLCIKTFGTDPLLDSQGQIMRWAGRRAPLETL